MNQTIHPKYHNQTKVSCTCGDSFETGSTLAEIHVEICSKCHPFFTGEMRFVDTQGRVEKFEAQRKKALSHQSTKPKKSAEAKQTDEPKTLKEMLAVLRHEKTNQKQAQTRNQNKASK